MAATTATPSTRLIPPADLYAFQRLLTLRETEDESQKGRLEHAFGVASSPSTEILDEAIAAYLLRHPEALQIIKEVEAFEADPSDYIPAVPVWKLEDHFSFHPTDNISHLRYRYLKEAATPFHQALKLLSSGGSEEKVLGLVRHAKDNCHPYFLTDWGRYFKLVGELANLDLYHQSKDLFGQENYDTYFIWGLAYAGHLELLKQQECREVDGIFGAAARAGTVRSHPGLSGRASPA